MEPRSGELAQLMRRLASELGRRRWTSTGDDPRKIGKLGGRPRSKAERCGCGAMTLKRAKARGHKCPKLSPVGDQPSTS